MKQEILQVIWEMLENLDFYLEEDEIASNEAEVAADRIYRMIPQSKFK